MPALTALLGLTVLAAAPPAAPAPVIDNERVTVWNLVLGPGESGPATPRDLDTVVVFLEGARIRTVGADGKAGEADRRFGEAVFVPKGGEARDTVVSGGPAHEIVVALKDHPVAPVENRTGLPPAFPRPGSVKALETGRLIVWNYSWAPGAPTPMHFHDKDVVVAYRYDGALKSVTADGQAVVNVYKSGEIRFNKADRSHYEELTTPRQAAVMVELK